MHVTQRLSANAIQTLKDALTAAFWFKKDLYSYARAAVSGEPLFLAGIEWTSPDVYKRDSVSTFVDRLAREQDEHQELLLQLLVDVAAMDDIPYLRRAEEPETKIAEARAAVARLRRVVEPYERALMEQQAARARIDTAQQMAADRRATSERLARLNATFYALMADPPQKRGFALEGLLRELFDTFDLDPHASFRVVGEQIDGGFTLDGTQHFIVEAKWEKGATSRDDLDIFLGKVNRRADNTLGLFFAVEGFQPTAIELHSSRRSPLVLADGGDLLAVLDERIDLPDLLRRKLRHASMTGEVFLPVSRILTTG